MSGYSIGDRVEVRWKDVLYPAEVTKLHSSGKVDVVYEINNTVGVFLTAKEHGLKLLPEKEGGAGKVVGGGGKKKVCSVEDCFNKSGSNIICSRHRAKPCSVEGCATRAKVRGLCNKHGANGKCVRPSCTGNAVKVGRHCWKHEPKLACAAPGCYTPQILGKFVCAKHGAFGICTVYACIRNACSGKGVLCFI